MYTRLGVSGVMLLLAIGVGGTSIWAQSVPPSAITDPLGRTAAGPSKSEYLHIHSCYDIFTGLSLNCRVKDQLVGLVPPLTDATNTGYHLLHSGPAPLTDRNAGAIGFECVACPDNDPAPLIVDTFTGNSAAIVRHQVPQFAGRIQIEGFSIPPFGWVCIGSCNFAFVEDIAVDGLSELEAFGSDHIITRNPPGGTDTRHPKGAYGTSTTLQTARTLAFLYHSLTGNKINYNDFSLPLGGKFDVNASYSENGDHNGHRRGTHFDINSTDGSGQSANCSLMVPMRLALSLIRSAIEPPICHEGGSGHVQVR
jgi:hypothetical protein